MINLDDFVKENIKERNPICPQIPDRTYRMLATGGFGFGLFDLINHQPHIYKFYLYAKDPYKEKYQFSIKGTSTDI